MSLLLLLSQSKTLSPQYGPLDFGPPLPVTSSKRKEIPIPYYYDYTYRDKYRYKNILRQEKYLHERSIGRSEEYDEYDDLYRDDPEDNYVDEYPYDRGDMLSRASNEGSRRFYNHREGPY